MAAWLYTVYMTEAIVVSYYLKYHNEGVIMEENWQSICIVRVQKLAKESPFSSPEPPGDLSTRDRRLWGNTI